MLEAARVRGSHFSLQRARRDSPLGALAAVVGNALDGVQPMPLTPAIWLGMVLIVSGAAGPTVLALALPNREGELR
jgi:hypothetical protein